MKTDLKAWVHRHAEAIGVLAYMLRLPDNTLQGHSFSERFPEDSLRAGIRCALNMYQVLNTQKLAATHLKWTFQKAGFHCARRSDGTLLGVFIPAEHDSPRQEQTEALLNRFVEVLELDD